MKNCGSMVHQEVATKEFMEFFKDTVKVDKNSLWQLSAQVAIIKNIRRQMSLRFSGSNLNGTIVVFSN